MTPYDEALAVASDAWRKQRPPLRKAISELGGTCAFALIVLTGDNPARRRQAKTKLFHYAMRVAFLLMDDPEVDDD